MEDDEWDAILREAEVADAKRQQEKSKMKAKRETRDDPKKTEAGQLEKALQADIAPTNVGHKLLLKMGFAGTIGNTNATRQNVLPLHQRRNVHTGLGVEEEEYRRAQDAVKELKRVEV
jgi:hypothetical protein